MTELRLRHGLLRLIAVLLAAFVGFVGLVEVAVAANHYAGMWLGFLWIAAAGLPFWLCLMAGCVWSVGENPIKVFREQWAEIKHSW